VLESRSERECETQPETDVEPDIRPVGSVTATERLCPIDTRASTQQRPRLDPIIVVHTRHPHRLHKQNQKQRPRHTNNPLPSVIIARPSTGLNTTVLMASAPKTSNYDRRPERETEARSSETSLCPLHTSITSISDTFPDSPKAVAPHPMPPP
jgi:hypothetical protein